MDLKEQRTHGKKAGNVKNRADDGERMMKSRSREDKRESRSNETAGERQEKSRTGKRRV